MADAELRALEREVAAGGDPAARVALAKQLERLGRRDDALQVLWRSHVVVLDPDDGIAPAPTPEVSS